MNCGGSRRRAAYERSVEPITGVVRGFEALLPGMRVVELPSYQVVSITPKALALLDCDTEAIAFEPRTMLDRVDMEDRFAVDTAHDMALGGEAVKVEYRVHHRDGKQLWICERSQIQVESGRTLLYSSLTNVTHERLESQRRRDAERNQQILFQELPLASVVVCRKTLRTLAANLEFQRLSNHSGAAFSQGNLSEFFTEPSVEAILELANMELFNPATLKLSLRSGVGNRREIATFVRAVHWEGKSALMLCAVGSAMLLHSISACQGCAETRELQSANRALSTFAHSISHDLRAPLRAIHGFADILNTEHCTELSPEALDCTRRIASAAARLDRMTADLLEYCRVREERLRLGKVSVREAFSNALALLQSELDEKHVRIEMQNDDVFVSGNSSGLSQIFVNLIGNAIKFVRDGENPEIRITAIDFDGRVRIRVSDNGIGIPDDRTSAVFEPFLRLHQPHRYPGTGLGLALVKDICHQMGGTCGVESEPGKGSTFWVELASEPLETAIADVTLDHIA